MSRWLPMMVLAVGVGVSTAPARSTAPSARTAAFALAEAAAKFAERQVVQLSLHCVALAKRYQDELDAIDRLKNQCVSWRRDRELRHSLSKSFETANQLSAASRELERASAALAITRQRHPTAIEANLGSGTGAARALELPWACRGLAPRGKDASHKIVIPDLETDPLADPEEIDQRVAELRESGDELGRVLAELDREVAALDDDAMLRKQHDPARALFHRGDDQPHRTPMRHDPPTTDDPAYLPNALGSATLMAENYTPIVLADVIDATTISSFSTALRSDDLAQRAEAVRRARDAVARRLDEVRGKRFELETRAAQRRSERTITSGDPAQHPSTCEVRIQGL